tara:strand:+ start:949 stop:1287 length:339 start_codon:yes stop_codon:yes gene_type:complete
MEREGRYQKDNRFWEIIYYLDINEILIRTGRIGTIGRLYIDYGFGENYDNIIIKKTNKKLSEGWKHVTKNINQEFNKDTLLDYRLEHYDYDGKKKKKSIKKTKKIKKSDKTK